MSQRNAAARRPVLGLDIGGANLKAATAEGHALSVPFALWREPQALPDRLRDLLRQVPHGCLAVTMTGELCDCFGTKREGVSAILDAVLKAAPRTPVKVWSTAGEFVTVEEARADPQSVAAANWHGSATFAGRFVPDGAALLLDVGSTTTDIIPLWNGKPRPKGWTDYERLNSSELVYTGVRRTPVCAVLKRGVAAELFATMHDVYLLLKKLPEEPANRDTADGRPATIACAHARLARMVCSDAEHFTSAQTLRLARQAQQCQVHDLGRAVQIVANALPAPPSVVIVSGAGEFLARAALQAVAKPRGYRVISLQRKLSSSVSAAACAYALAVLGEETRRR